MADDPENLMLVYLRRLDTKMDRLIDDVADLKARMTGVEEAVAGQSRRIDRMEGRLDHIERRLDLREQV
jgi:uncharacterized coiled-coil protein SlyX